MQIKDTRFTPMILQGIILLISWGIHSSVSAAPEDACSAAAAHYARGDIPHRDIVDKFEQIAQKGDVRGKMWLARLHFKGRCSLPKSPEKAQKMAKAVLEDVRKLAKEGDSEAQFLLGSSYNEGLGVELDFEKAGKWFLKAAPSGHMVAINNLAVMLVWGQGMDPNIDEARRHFARAAKLGSTMAKSNTHKFRDDGRDDREKLKTLRKSVLVQAVGMKVDTGIAFLVKNALITDPKGYDAKIAKSQNRYLFQTDGIRMTVFKDSGRIVTVDGHAKGFRDTEQFRGGIPFGLNWSDSPASTRKKLGNPDDSGSVANDNAYGMAYIIENVNFSVMYEYGGDHKIKLWRVAERWADRPTR